MPNWCANQLDINGDEAEVARLIELVKGDDDGFDFSKIVPVPTNKFYTLNEGQNDFQCGCKQVWVERDDLPEVKSYTLAWTRGVWTSAHCACIAITTNSYSRIRIRR